MNSLLSRVELHTKIRQMRNMKYLRPVPSLILILLLLIPGVLMAFGKTFVLCSPVYGIAVTANDEPAAGIEIVREWTWTWNDQKGRDVTVTDAGGRFEFPLVEGSSLGAMFLPHEPNIMQVFTAKLPAGDLEILSISKDSYDLNSELNGKPTRIRCHLDREPSPDGLYWGTCEEDQSQ